MDLIYIWVAQYGVINQEGFNLSAQFDISIKNEPMEFLPIEYQLTIRANKDYCNIFPEQIRDVIAIVGMNGSGKSSILNL